MTTLSRRQLLLGLGAVGACSAGAGFGSVGYLTDRERVPNVTTAGTLELKLGYRSTYNGEPLASAPGEDDAVDCDTPGLVDGDGVPVIELADVKPGDCGTLTTTLYVCGNPSRLWLAVDVVDAAENDRRPEEILAGDETVDVGELGELVDVTVRIDADGVVDGTDRVVYEGTLAGLGAAGDDDGWIPLTATCAAPGTHVATLRWTLPSDAPNTVQTDGVSFSLGVAADTSGCA